MFNKNDIKDIYSLAPMQEGMLFHHLMDKSTQASLLQMSFMFKTAIDLELFEKSFNHLLARHDVLRTFFFYHKNKKPRQLVLKEWKVKFRYFDISYQTPEERRIFIDRYKLEDRQKGFDLFQEIPIRVAVIKGGPEEFQLIWSSHHILMDGWCMGIVLRDFIEIYEMLKKGRSVHLEPVPPYSDYIRWLDQKDKFAGLRFWERYLDGYDVPVKIPSFYPENAADPGYSVREHRLMIEPRMTEILINISRTRHVTLNNLFQTAWGVLLQKYNNTRDVVYGAIVSGRPAEIEGVEDMVGTFINAVPVRVSASPRQSFSHLLAEVKDRTIQAKPFEYLPLAEVQSCSPLKRDLVNHILVFENYPYKERLQDVDPAGSGDMELQGLGLFIQTEYNFNIIVMPGPAIRVTFNYNSKVFDPSFVEALASHFNSILTGVAADCDIAVDDIDYLSGAERLRLLAEFNDTRQEFPLNKTAHQLFEDQAQRTPDSVAVVYKDSALSYEILNIDASKWSSRLASLGAGRGATVAIMMENPVAVVTGILAIMKTGACYLPLDPAYPQERLRMILSDSNARILLTSEPDIRPFQFALLESFERAFVEPVATNRRPMEEELDSLQFPDRSYMDYEKYSPYIGQSMMKNALTFHFSRGCVFNCAYCFKIWPNNKYVNRSGENMFEEIKMYYDMGVRRFAFVDDLPNFNIEESAKFLRMIIKNRLSLFMYFPNGLRGDILTEDYIDLMAEAGAVSIDLALETTSSRLQKLVRKNLDIDRLHKNIEYFLDKHPQIILETQILHGIPTETEEEAMHTLEFLKQLKWIHFPYLHVMKIYPNTDMERLALENGVSKEAIVGADRLGYNELPDTLPFSRRFSHQYQSEFASEYLMLGERMRSVLPPLMRATTEDELMQKYNSFLPVKFNNFDDFLQYIGIEREELDAEFLPENWGKVENINEKIRSAFPAKKPRHDAIRVLLMDISAYFRHDRHNVIYDVVDPSLGLMYVQTYLDKKLGDGVRGKIISSRIDYDNFDELKAIIMDFQPHVIGIRTLNFYKDFFHQTVSLIKQWVPATLVVAGGPYATSSYRSMLKDIHIDVAVIGEGEAAFLDLIQRCIKNGNALPTEEELRTIPSIAFLPEKEKEIARRHSCKIWMIDREERGGATSRSTGENAYIIYTSGSTGIPKGVVIRHRNLVNQVMGIQRLLGAGGHLNFILLAAFTFDVSVMHIFLALSSGARLHLLDNRVKKDPAGLVNFLKRHCIDVVNMVPAFMEALLEYNETKSFRFRYLLLGGEAFSRSLHQRVSSSLLVDHLINIYGPTETAINATHYLCDGDFPGNTVPIGKPLDNYRTYVLDCNRKPVPTGVPGELYIAGAGVAAGYLNRPELTAEKFVPNPIIPTEPAFKTGDLARWLPGGNLEFLGRSDNQVKIRGFRIELDEIRDQMLQQTGVADAAVIVREDEGGGRSICAYYTMASCDCDNHMESCAGVDADPFENVIRQRLAASLPEYMMPSYLVLLEEIPKNAQGKLDRQALPLPQSLVNAVVVHPRDWVEERLAALWAEVVNMSPDAISIDANFFDLGGHSLKATVLISRIHKHLNVRVPMSVLFKTPTIRNLGRYIKESEAERFKPVRPAEKRDYYPLSSAQKRLYIVQNLKTANTSFNMPLTMVLEGDLERKKLETAFKKLIQRHESLRTAFHLKDTEPIQRIFPEVDFSLEYIDISRQRREEGDEAFDMREIERKIVADFVRPFDLSVPGQLRAGLIRTEERVYILMVDLHHIITDGLSMNIMTEEFIALYSGAELELLPLQYKDYSQWLEEERYNGALKAQEEYWLGQFAGGMPEFPLPTDFSRPENPNFEGETLVFQLDRELAGRIKTVCGKYAVTLQIYFTSLLAILMFKYTGCEDFALGTGVAGRRHADLERIIGMFINMLALRVKPRSAKSFDKFLAEVKDTSINAFANQDFQFEELVKKLNLQRDPARNPIFDAVFQMQNLDADDGIIGDFSVKPYKTKKRSSHFDLVIYGVEGDSFINLIMVYSTDLFKKETAERMAADFTAIVRQTVTNPESLLEEIDVFQHKTEAGATEFLEDTGDFVF